MVLNSFIYENKVFFTVNIGVATLSDDITFDFFTFAAINFDEEEKCFFFNWWRQIVKRHRRKYNFLKVVNNQYTNMKKNIFYSCSNVCFFHALFG